MDLYAFLAPYYDALFPVSKAQRDFLARRLAAPEIAGVVDAGCGTGRHLELLARQDLRLAGIEPSPSMAAVAKERLARLGWDLDLAVAPLEEARGRLNGPYDAALCLGNTLAHLDTLPRLDEGLAALAELVASGGLLVTQTVNFDALLEAGRWSFPDQHIEDPEHGLLVFRRRYDFKAAPEHLRFQLELTGTDLALSEAMSLKPYTLAEQRAALERAGFRLAEICGNWDDSRFAPDSPALILCARRNR